jgi:cell wall-associated NlpC family hydrolase
MSRPALICLLVLVAATAAIPFAREAAATAPRAPVTTSRPRDAVRPQAAVITRAERAVRAALRMVGAPYRWGGAGPGGFDCSGLVMWAYGRSGMRLPHNAWSQSRLGRTVTRAELDVGDLLFFHGYGHVGIYVGRGRMVHAPQSGERVEVIRLAGRHGRRFETARRLFPT